MDDASRRRAAARAGLSHRVVGALTGLFILVVAGVATWSLWVVAVADQERRLQSTADFVSETLQHTLNGIERESLAIAGLAASSEELTPTEFRTFVSVALASPGVIGRGLVSARIGADGDVEHFFSLWEGADDGPDWLNAEIPRPRILGYTFDRSIDSGATQASGFLVLGLGREVVLVFSPITGGDNVAAAILVDVEALRVGSIAETLNDDITVSVHESTPTPTGRFVATRAIEIGERRYEVLIQPTSGSALADLDRTWWILPILLSLVAAMAGGVIAAVVVERRRVRAELLAAREMDQRRLEFLASVSHELRTPITAMTGFSRLLRDAWDDLPDSERRDVVSLIDEQGQEVASMITDLLLLARADSGNIQLSVQDTDVRALIDRVLGSVSPEDAPRLTVDVPEIVVEADPTRLAQVIRNLVMNALIHGRGEVNVSARSGDDFMIAKVTDEGDGIPPGAIESLFQPFNGAARGGTERLPSTGVGLYVSKRLVDLMGGTLAYFRERDLTVFEVRLPRASDTPIPSPVNAPLPASN